MGLFRAKGCIDKRVSIMMSTMSMMRQNDDAVGRKEAMPAMFRIRTSVKWAYSEQKSHKESDNKKD